MTCVIKKAEETSIALVLTYQRWTPVSLMFLPVPAGRMTGSTAISANSWAQNFHPHFCNSTIWFLSSLPLSWSLSASVAVFSPIWLHCIRASKELWFGFFTASPWSRLPSLCVLCSSQRFRAVILFQRGKKCAAENLQPWQREQKHRACFQVEICQLLTKTLQFSAEMLSAFKFASFFYSLLFSSRSPDSTPPIKHLGMRVRSMEKNALNMEKTTVIFVWY